MNVNQFTTQNLAFFLFIFLDACSAVSPVEQKTQKLEITSGEIATPGIAEIISVDFVRFSDEDPRYSETIRNAATEWIISTGESVSEAVKAAVSTGSGAISEEIEQFIRDSNCIYVIRPSRGGFLERVQEDLDTRELGAVEIAQDILTEEEFSALEELPFEEYLAELDEIKKTFDEQVVEDDSPRRQTEGDDLIAVASQCFSDVRVGDMVSVFKFDDLVAISPRTTAQSFAG